MIERPDFGRVSELFMRKVRSGTAAHDLGGLIGHAITAYKQELEVFPCSHVQVTYPSSSPGTHITFQVAAQYTEPDITSIAIFGNSRLEELLPQLEGPFSAEFDLLPFSDIPGKFRRRLDTEEREQLVARLLFQLIIARGGAPRLRRVSYQRPDGKFLPWEEPQILDAVVLKKVLDSPTLTLLSRASRIRVDNPHYMMEDWFKPLIQEECVFRRQGGGFSWRYSAATVDQGPLPAELSGRVLSAFRLVSGYFSEDSIERQKLLRPSQMGSVKGCEYGE